MYIGTKTAIESFIARLYNLNTIHMNKIIIQNALYVSYNLISYKYLNTAKN